MEKILVIDDDPDVISLMRMLLQKKHYDVASASQESEVEELVLNFKPDIIIMDVLLSGADGRSICKNLKNAEASKHIPIIMFSGHPGAQKNIDEYGADEFISKPFQSSSLLERIKHHLEKRKVNDL